MLNVVQLSSVFKNQPTKVVVSKSDLTTGVELSGATLTVLDKNGNVVDTWKSVKGEQHLIERLAVGEKLYSQRRNGSLWIPQGRRNHFYD